jgi:hypothetical protein
LNLETPHGTRHYDQIFDRAIDEVGKIWVAIANGVFKGEEVLASAPPKSIGYIPAF